jgi:putative transposase
MKRWIQKQKLDENKGDLVISRNGGRYYFCVPLTRSTKPSNPKYDTVALDPGVRTFQTIYSSEGIAGKLGDGICDKLTSLGLKEDHLKSVLSNIKVKSKTKSNIRKRCSLLRTKIKNIVNDLHWKTAHYLCSTFKRIYIPTFEVSNMVCKGIPERARKINSKAVRKMISLSHYAFKEKLLYMAQTKHVQVEIVSEAYTSKTCGGCGYIKNNLGGAKVYKCDQCPFELDRDYNGARNILLRNGV